MLLVRNHTPLHHTFRIFQAARPFKQNFQSILIVSMILKNECEACLTKEEYILPLCEGKAELECKKTSASGQQLQWQVLSHDPFFYLLDFKKQLESEKWDMVKA